MSAVREEVSTDAKTSVQHLWNYGRDTRNSCQHRISRVLGGGLKEWLNKKYFGNIPLTKDVQSIVRHNIVFVKTTDQISLTK